MVSVDVKHHVYLLTYVKTEETVSHRQNKNVKEVGTPPVRINLCTPLIAVSTAEDRHKDSVRNATVEEHLSSKTINPSSYESPAPPPFSWSLLGSVSSAYASSMVLYVHRSREAY